LAQQSTFLEELMAAGRGIGGLLVGNRRAGSYFDFSRRGVYGSFIAILLIVALGATLPLILSAQHDSILSSVIQLVVIYASQIGFAALVLRQTKRMDAFFPFLVGYNWLNFFGTLVLAACLAAGVGGNILLIVVAIAVIFVQVNICRILMTLAPLQTAALIIAQIVGVVLALFVLTLIFPMPPDAAAQFLG
jgi:hypothetical protein